MPMRIRFLASAGATRSQSGFGTTPNIAPPSSAKNPSLSGTRSRLPKVIDGDVTSVALRRPVPSARTALGPGVSALDDIARGRVGVERLAR